MNITFNSNKVLLKHKNQNSIIRHNTTEPTAKVIARWDVVPYQPIGYEPFTLGVNAFHMNDIDRVEISVNGSDTRSVTEMTLNARTNVYEYCTTFTPEDLQLFSEGPIEFNAVAYPKGAGLPRTLSPLVLQLHKNDTPPEKIAWCGPEGSDETGDGSEENPYRQPYRAAQARAWANGGNNSEPDAADGIVILLKAGEYDFGITNANYRPVNLNEWITFRGAPGVPRSDVKFTNYISGGFNINLLKLQSLTMDSCYIGTATGEVRCLWIDDCHIAGPGLADVNFEPYLAQNWSGVWITDTTIEDVRNAAQGAQILRNVVARNLFSDAFGDSWLVLNCKVDGIDRGETTNHPDVYQFSGSGVRENVIIFGLEAKDARCQGLFADDLDQLANIAVVNVEIVLPLWHVPTNPYFSQWAVPTRHLLLWNVSLPNSTFRFRSTSMDEVSVRGCVFFDVVTTSGGVLSEEWFQDTHIIDPNQVTIPWGTNGSTGDAGFLDEASGDFTPAVGSILRNRVLNPKVPIDLVGELRGNPSTVGPREG